MRSSRCNRASWLKRGLRRFGGATREEAIAVRASLRVATVNLDLAIEAGAVFNVNPGRSEVTSDRAVFLDLDAVASAYIALNAAKHDHLARHDIRGDRKSTRLNSSHLVISYAVFCLKKKKNYDMNI